MMMLCYYLHEYASRLKAWYEAERCAARIDANLRAYGFVETAPGRWVRPL